MKRALLTIVAIGLVSVPTPGRAADAGRTLAVRAGRILTVSNGAIENGVITVRDGKIDGVGVDLAVPKGMETIDAGDKVVVPGFIDAHCHLGLSLNAMAEIDETVQPVTAQMRIIDAFDPTADELAQAVRAGVTTMMLAPGGRNPIGGQTAVVKLSGDRRKRWLVKPSAGVEMSFTSDALMSDRRPTSRPGLITLVQENLDKAAGYESDTFAPTAEVLSRLTRRELPAYVRAVAVDEIDAALSVIDRYELAAVLVGAQQADEMAEMLVEREVAVICGPQLLHSQDHDLKRAGRLAAAGVKVAFGSFAPRTMSGDIRTSAILAVRYGLKRDEALKALTINAAEILGLDGRLGSIQPGRDADLVILDGDPLEPASRVETVIIDGNVVYRREQK